MRLGKATFFVSRLLSTLLYPPEPDFSVLLIRLIVAVLSQYLAVIGVEVPVLHMLRTGDSNVILVESAFIGFLAVTLIRSRR